MRVNQTNRLASCRLKASRVRHGGFQAKSSHRPSCDLSHKVTQRHTKSRRGVYVVCGDWSSSLSLSFLQLVTACGKHLRVVTKGTPTRTNHSRVLHLFVNATRLPLISTSTNATRGVAFVRTFQVSYERFKCHESFTYSLTRAICLSFLTLLPLCDIIISVIQRTRIQSSLT